MDVLANVMYFLAIVIAARIGVFARSRGIFGASSGQVETGGRDLSRSDLVTSDLVTPWGGCVTW